MTIVLPRICGTYTRKVTVQDGLSFCRPQCRTVRSHRASKKRGIRSSTSASFHGAGCGACWTTCNGIRANISFLRTCTNGTNQPNTHAGWNNAVFLDMVRVRMAQDSIGRAQSSVHLETLSRNNGPGSGIASHLGSDQVYGILWQRQCPIVP